MESDESSSTSGSKQKDKKGGCLTVTRVKKIMKFHGEVDLVSKEAAHVMTRATEEFLKMFATQAFEQAKGMKITYKNISDVVQSDDKYRFLRDIIPQKITMGEFVELQRKKEKTDEEKEAEEEENFVGKIEDSEVKSSEHIHQLNCALENAIEYETVTEAEAEMEVAKIVIPEDPSQVTSSEVTTEIARLITRTDCLKEEETTSQTKPEIESHTESSGIATESSGIATDSSGIATESSEIGTEFAYSEVRTRSKYAKSRGKPHYIRGRSAKRSRRF